MYRSSMFTKDDVQQLIQEIAKLNAEIADLRKINAQQQEQIAALLKENQELKEKLGTNSSNSSLPPSQDMNRTKRAKKSNGRKPGGQLGHSGHSRKLFPRNKFKSL